MLASQVGHRESALTDVECLSEYLDLLRLYAHADRVSVPPLPFAVREAAPLDRDRPPNGRGTGTHVKHLVRSARFSRVPPRCFRVRLL